MVEAEPVLIAAMSGRALAASARRAGYRPLVADCFGDEDTLALAHAHRRLTLDFHRGIDRDELVDALDDLATTSGPAAVVCGTGFEDRPEVLAIMAERWTLLGNSAATVMSAKDPTRFAALCREQGIRHPPTRADVPADPDGWLAKRRGGAGGAHVRTADAAATSTNGLYYQQRVAGAAVSALVLANGRSAVILGFSTQWTSPTARQPFRYGGAVRPAALGRETADALADSVARLVRAIPIVGLNSVDFLVEGDRHWLLELNPRPGATLDIFEPTQGSLFGLHVEACAGALPDRAPDLKDAMAQSIVYAHRDIPALPVLDWPDWTADRQRAASSVGAGQPLCTVLAAAPTDRDARELIEQRIAAIRTHVDARSP